MILRFSPKIELNSWHNSGPYMEPNWVRTLIPYEDYDETIIVSVRRDWHSGMYYVNFYSQLAFLHDHFPIELIAIDMDHAKRQVDQFLIRMSKLTPFL